MSGGKIEEELIDAFKQFKAERGKEEETFDYDVVSLEPEFGLVNGKYVRDAEENGRFMYVQEDGECVVYFNDYWKLSRRLPENSPQKEANIEVDLKRNPAGVYFCSTHGARDAHPPETGWVGASEDLGARSPGRQQAVEFVKKTKVTREKGSDKDRFEKSLQAESSMSFDFGGSTMSLPSAEPAPSPPGHKSSLLMPTVSEGGKTTRLHPSSTSEGDPLVVSKKTELIGAKFTSTQKQVDAKLWAYGMNHDQLHEQLHVKRSLREHFKKKHGATFWRLKCMHVAQHDLFHFKCVLVTLLNCACLAHVANSPDGEAREANGISIVCVVFFAIEFGVRFLGDIHSSVLQNGWLIADGILLLPALADIAAMMYENRSNHKLIWLRAPLVFRMLRLLRLSKFFQFTRPLQLMLGTIEGAWASLLACCLFAGLTFVTFGIFTTALIGKAAGDADGEEIQQLAAEFFGSVPKSLVTAMEITIGGVAWSRDIIQPLLQSDILGWQLTGWALLCCAMFFLFGLWNLLLGTYIKEVMHVGRSHDQNMELWNLYNGSVNIEKLRLLLDAVDRDGDGALSMEETLEATEGDNEILNVTGIGPAELRALHQALDTEGTGLVSTSEILFGVLKLTGASKTIDMLSIDYRQKALLRELATQEKTMTRSIETLSAPLDKIDSKMERLTSRMDDVQAKSEDARRFLKERIEHVDRNLVLRRHHFQQKELVEKQLREHSSLRVRRSLAERLDALTREVDELAERRRHQDAHLLFSDMSQGRGPTKTELREAVRRKLASDLQPWLEEALVGGGTGPDDAEASHL